MALFGNNDQPNEETTTATPDFGPYDADTVNFSDLDFSDFAKGGLDLGSMMIPVPHEGEVQVLSLIHISEPTRQCCTSRMPSSA